MGTKHQHLQIAGATVQQEFPNQAVAGRYLPYSIATPERILDYLTHVYYQTTTTPLSLVVALLSFLPFFGNEATLNKAKSRFLVRCEDLLRGCIFKQSKFIYSVLMQLLGVFQGLNHLELLELKPVDLVLKLLVILSNLPQFLVSIGRMHLRLSSMKIFETLTSMLV
jgi:hypothetical protein